MHKPDMEIPISNSLNINSKKKLKYKNLNISFLSPDSKKFPIIKLGYKILRHHKHIAMIFFTVLNDRLAKLYLKSEIKYGDINFYLVKAFRNNLLQKYLKNKINNVNDILKIIKIAETLKLK